MNQNKLALILIPVVAIAAGWFIYPSIVKPKIDTAASVSKEYSEGLELIKQGKLDEARKKLEEGIAKEPAEGKYHFALGNVERMQSKMEAALTQYEQAVQKSPQIKEAYNNIAAIHMLQNKNEQALAAIDRGLKEDPNYKDLIFKKGQLFYIKGSLTEAVEALKPLTGDAEYVEALRFIGLSYAKQNDPAQALQYLKSYLQKTAPNTQGRQELEKLVADLENKGG